jgi:hypothetical protein
VGCQLPEPEFVHFFRQVVGAPAVSKEVLRDCAPEVERGSMPIASLEIGIRPFEIEIGDYRGGHGPTIQEPF